MIKTNEKISKEFDKEWNTVDITRDSIQFQEKFKSFLFSKIDQALKSDREELIKEYRQFVDAAEMLWVVLANVSEGDWTKQNEEWQEAVIKWRDNYFEKLKAIEIINFEENFNKINEKLDKLK